MTNIERWERIGRWFMTAWILFLVPGIGQILTTGLNPVTLAAAAMLFAWALTWAWLWLRVIGRDHRGEVVGLVAITVIELVFTAIQPGPGTTTILVFSFIVAGCIYSPARAAAALVVLSVVQVGILEARFVDQLSTLNILINDVLVGMLGLGARFFWRAYRELVGAREQLADLAVAEERLRFARDLHDLLGQSLSVLVLKSELVAKQLPEDTDESVRQDVRDIAQVARVSLNDVREAVAGYRQASLRSEISSARSALRAAGIGLLVEDSAGSLAADQDGVLAWCLREAVTNVVKHSGAKKCEVRLSRQDGSASLEVSDDGRGAARLDGGSGLAGMRERVALVGGTMKVGSENGGGLHLQVSVPQPA